MVTSGAIALFYTFVYQKILNACENVYVRVSVHLIGLIVMIFGLRYFIVTKPSVLGAIGLFIIVWGITIFIIPFGTEK
ncbi:MAG: hypothetical protein JSW06_06365 [Thermoplasmatales archaeon]|nr:MAG: hypothetical protein JSW06_06365 [Thermoplasmatales archaeon]